MELYAPLTYWQASDNIRTEVCNGCGAKEGIDVPDTLWGLSITEACNIHDWMYKEGKTRVDKLFADAIFRMNVSILIDSNSNFLTSILRHKRASTYYIAVAKWGEKAFWVGKEINNSSKITFKGEFR